MVNGIWYVFQVGEIPQGLPTFSIPKNFGYAKSLIPTALLITGVAILVRSCGVHLALGGLYAYWVVTM